MVVYEVFFGYLGLFQSYIIIYFETDKYYLVISLAMKTYKGELQTYTSITLLYIEGSVQQVVKIYLLKYKI